MVQKPLEVVGAVVRGDVHGEPAVLAFRRRTEKAAGGMWEFPGGKVERAESQQDALAREIYEELGVEISVGELVTRASTVVGDRVIDLACYWVTTREVPRASSDHDAIRWTTLAELRSLDWAKPDLPALKVIEEVLSQDLRGGQ